MNSDFYVRGIVIKQKNDILIIENPGTIRVGKYQMKVGGESDPRNKALMKMFNLIGIGERAGSGVPELFSVWEQEGWMEPDIKETYNPGRTILTLPFMKKNEEAKRRKENCGKKSAGRKTLAQYEMMLSMMQPDVWYRSSDFSQLLHVKERRIQTLLKELCENGCIEDNGLIKGKRYKKARN